MNLLELIILLPFFISIIVFFLDIADIKLLKIFALSMSFLIFLLSLLLWVQFDNLYLGYQFVSFYNIFQGINISYCIGIDGLSLLLIILTTFLFPICFLCSWTSVVYRVKEFIVLMFLLEFFLLNVFSVLDVLLFYIFFEAVLIPMFLIIGIWGSRDRRVHAAYYFFFYTLIGSLIMLLAIIYLYLQVGSTNLYSLGLYSFTLEQQKILWLAFFCSFVVKIPMIPVHIWLPEAHVESPTAGSVILAGILLKMGPYGLLRFSIPLFPLGMEYFLPLVYLLSLLGVVYGSLATIRQIDIKKIIAYSSVGHMGFVTMGVISNNVQGIEGGIFLMLGHGIVSSGLFLCVGILYERYHTRIVTYYSGLTLAMPVFGFIFFIFTLANMGMPGLVNFIGELLILVGCVGVNYLVAIIGALGIILNGVYSIWLYTRLMSGELGEYIYKYSDLNLREVLYLGWLVVIVFIMGIKPDIFLNSLHVTVLGLIQNVV